MILLLSLSLVAHASEKVKQPAPKPESPPDLQAQLEELFQNQSFIFSEKEEVVGCEK